MLDTDKLKQFREGAGLSMEDAAQKAGLTNRQQWYLIESGRNANITLGTLDKIAAALGCTPCDLLKAPARRQKGA